MRALAVRVALIGLFFWRSAGAQPYAPPAPPPPPPLVPLPPGLRLFPIVVQGHPWDLKVALSTEENGKPFLYCQGTCDAWAYPGEYWVAVRSTPHTAAGQRRIRLSGSSRIDVRARDKDEQAIPTTVGLVFLGGGAGMFTLGLVTAPSGPETEDNRADYSLSVVLLLGGLLSATAGLVLLLVGGTRDTTIPNVDIATAD